MTIDLPDPTFLLSLYNRDVREGRVKCHPWQVRFHQWFSAEGWDYTTGVKRAALVANNGAGKSSLIIAPCVVWQSMRYELSRSVVTSSSGVQLDRQTGRAIIRLCEQVNRTHGREIWELKYREYTNRETGSIIELFATDEAGKAEGYHPIEPGRMFSLWADEAKSIHDSIFEANIRCTGMTHWILVSSPGAPRGFFYNAVISPRWNAQKITAYDCPHIRKEEIEAAAEIYGESSPIFRSAYLAEFTSVDEQVVLLYDKIRAQILNPPAQILEDGKLRAGLDLSAGGDEQVLAVFKGNQAIGLEPFRITETNAIVDHILRLREKYGLAGPDTFVDDGYTGRAIIDLLRAKGFPVVAVRFGSKAFNSKAYANRGTELWWNFSILFQSLRLLDDRTLVNQLSSRYYMQSRTNDRLILESKREARAKGHASPDRADAVVLAWAGTSPNHYKHYEQTIPQESEVQGDLLSRIAKLKGQAAELSDDELGELVELYRQKKAARHVEPGQIPAKSVADKWQPGRHYQLLDVDRQLAEKGLT